MDKEKIKIVCASSNRSKIKEINAALGLNYEIIGQEDVGLDAVDETGETFVENAILKARNACILTNKISLADDSGIVVPALGGEPGIRSARYSDSGSDADNREKLLQRMRNIADRRAYFCCALVLMSPSAMASPLVVQQWWRGSVGHDERGSGGFGYDSLFMIDGMSCRAAELTMEQKNQISHRGKALQELARQLDQFLAMDIG